MLIFTFQCISAVVVVDDDEDDEDSEKSAQWKRKHL